MTIATYKDFKIINKLEKTIEKLENNNFSQVKKLSNLPYFRIKVNYEDRIIFTFFKYEDKNYILLLEYIKNHEYEKSRFLRGKKWDEEDFKFLEEDIEDIIYINDKKEFSYFDKFISFSKVQKDIIDSNPPIILIGSAGSGKTSILIEKLQTFNKKVLYISLSKNLVENSKEISNCNKNIEFKTFFELFNITNEVTFEIFKKFAKKYSIKEIEKYYEEFRGVITGNFEKPYLLKDDYINLGVKNSLFIKKDREEVYLRFEKYLAFLYSEKLIDSNIEQLEISTNYDFIVIDEIQDFTNSQIFTILKYGNNFILAGDSNQIIYSNFFSWSKLKTMLFKSDEKSQISILRENYRNSKSITNISNNLLKIKQLRFGSIDKESNYLIETISKKEGELFFWTNSKMELELNEKRKDDVTFAVIVFDEKSKQEAVNTFDTPLIFTVQEAKGLEYKNVILFNFVSNESKKFLDIISNIDKNDLNQELQYSRPKDKTDRELDIYKIYINSLYVAFTRGIENLYIVEKEKHKLWEVLGVIESKRITFTQISSKEEEWIKESKKLEKFGRTEQVKKIDKKLKSKRIITPKIKPIRVKLGLEDYRKLVFDDNKATKSNKDKLFKLAKSENNLELVKEIAEKLDFKSAKMYLTKLGDNSLKQAIENVDLTLLENSIKNGASVKGMDIGLLVLKKVDINFLEVLINNGANVDSIDKDSGFTALMITSQLGYTIIARLLIENSDDLDLKAYNGATSLIIASEYGHIEIIKLLLEKNADINIQSKNGATCLTLASGNKHIEIVKLLIEHGVNLNYTNKYGRSALGWACENGFTEISYLLIDNGADLNIQNQDGITALISASYYGYKEIAKYLINNGANLDIQNNQFNGSSLIIASEKGHKEIAKCLIENNANLDLKLKSGETALILASENEHIEIAKYLIVNGANLNIRGENGATALKLASELGNLKLVKLLIENGANLDLQNRSSVNALSTASQHGYIEIVKLLVESGANFNLVDERGYSSLMSALELGYIDIVKLLIEHGVNLDLQENILEFSALIMVSLSGNTQILKLLIENGANLNLQDKDGKTAFLYASYFGNIEIINFLFIHGANTMLKSNNSFSSLMYASQEGNIEVVKFLIKNDINKIDFQSNEGYSALPLACENGHIETVKLLINNNANINLCDKRNRNALIRASINGHIEIVKLLIENGSDINLQTKDGFTALMMATERGHIEIVEFLIKNKANLDLENKFALTAFDIASKYGDTEIIKFLKRKDNKEQKCLN